MTLTSPAYLFQFTTPPEAFPPTQNRQLLTHLLVCIFHLVAQVDHLSAYPSGLEYLHTVAPMTLTSPTGSGVTVILDNSEAKRWSLKIVACVAYNNGWYCEEEIENRESWRYFQ